MKVSCSSCGEELLGSVNRCWRCGTEIVSRPGAVAEPPLRRGPVDLQAPPDNLQTGELLAELADTGDSAIQGAAPLEANAVISNSPNDSPSAETVEPAGDRASVTTKANVEADSSKPAASSSGAATADFLSAPRPTYYPRHTAATGGAVGALLLALMSLGGAYFTIGAALTALLGIVLGAWGIYSNYRAIAIFAMVLCCIALLLASAFGAIHLYTDIYGYSPFEQRPPLEDGYDDLNEYQ